MDTGPAPVADRGYLIRGAVPQRIAAEGAIFGCLANNAVMADRPARDGRCEPAMEIGGAIAVLTVVSALIAALLR